MNTIAGIRLASHQLAGKKFQTPKELVSWMGAMQAQDFSMAKWAVGVRLSNYTDKMVEEAFNKGDIVRTHVMRPTWHFVAPENIRWMLQLSADKIKASTRSRDRQLDITEALYNKSNRIIQKALEKNTCLTRDEIGKELERAKIGVNSARLVHFLMRTELEALVCSGPLKGRTQTYALLDERVPQARPLHRDEALAELTRLYFRSHCPAAIQDFVWWSGLPQTEAKAAVESIRQELRAEEIGGRMYWRAGSFGKNVHKETVFLLPAFDEYIIAYRDRTDVLPLKDFNKAVSNNGVFRPVILENGQVIGIWKKANTKTPEVVFDFFKKPDNFLMRNVEKAAAAFIAFLKGR